MAAVKGKWGGKKTWERPILTVLVRSKLGSEDALRCCKTGIASHSSSPGASRGECVWSIGPPSYCQKGCDSVVCS